MIICIYIASLYKVTCALGIVSTYTRLVILLFCNTCSITIFNTTILIVSVCCGNGCTTTTIFSMYARSTTICRRTGVIICIYRTCAYYIGCTLWIISTCTFLIILTSCKTSCGCVLNSTVYIISMRRANGCTTTCILGVNTRSSTVCGRTCMVTAVNIANFYKIACALRIVSTYTRLVVLLLCSTGSVTILNTAILVVSMRRANCCTTACVLSVNTRSSTVCRCSSVIACVDSTICSITSCTYGLCSTCCRSTSMAENVTACCTASATCCLFSTCCRTIIMAKCISIGLITSCTYLSSCTSCCSTSMS